MGRSDSLLTLLGLSPSAWGKKKGDKRPDGGNTTPVAAEIHVGEVHSSVSVADGGGSGSWFGGLLRGILEGLGLKRERDGQRHRDEGSGNHPE
jgi:hypothetical protein